MQSTYTCGTTYFELCNQLGNPDSGSGQVVLTVVTDRKFAVDDGGGGISYYTPDVVSATDYYPFGMQMSERSVSSDNYRYGFNGMEKDEEVKGSGNSYDFGARLLDVRLGRWLAVDPLAGKYPDFSTFCFSTNSPIIFVDPDGKVVKISIFTPTNLSLYNSSVKKMNASGIFSKVYSNINSSNSYFNVYQIPKSDIAKGMSEEGDFTASREPKSQGFGCSGPAQPGTSKNPHQIGLIQPIGKNNRGFQQGVIFEEIFHAYQYNVNPSNENKLEIETEAKVAKVYQYYSQYGSNLDELIKKQKEFGIGTYELQLLIDIDENNVAIGINSNVKNYFDALANGNTITPEMEKAFRSEVKKLGERVNKRYKEHFKGKKYENTGKTKNFDKLFKKT